MPNIFDLIREVGRLKGEKTARDKGLNTALGVGASATAHLRGQQRTIQSQQHDDEQRQKQNVFSSMKQRESERAVDERQDRSIGRQIEAENARAGRQEERDHATQERFDRSQRGTEDRFNQSQERMRQESERSQSNILGRIARQREEDQAKEAKKENEPANVLARIRAQSNLDTLQKNDAALGTDEEERLAVTDPSEYNSILTRRNKKPPTEEQQSEEELRGLIAKDQLPRKREDLYKSSMGRSILEDIRQDENREFTREQSAANKVEKDKEQAAAKKTSYDVKVETERARIREKIGNDIKYRHLSQQEIEAEVDKAFKKKWPTGIPHGGSGGSGGSLEGGSGAPERSFRDVLGQEELSSKDIEILQQELQLLAESGEATPEQLKQYTDAIAKGLKYQSGPDIDYSDRPIDIADKAKAAENAKTILGIFGNIAMTGAMGGIGGGILKGIGAEAKSAWQLFNAARKAGQTGAGISAAAQRALPLAPVVGEQIMEADDPGSTGLSVLPEIPSVKAASTTLNEGILSAPVVIAKKLKEAGTELAQRMGIKARPMEIDAERALLASKGVKLDPVTKDILGHEDNIEAIPDVYKITKPKTVEFENAKIKDHEDVNVGYSKIDIDGTDDKLIAQFLKGDKTAFDKMSPEGQQAALITKEKIVDLILKDAGVSNVPVNPNPSITKYPGPNQKQTVFSGMLEKNDKLGPLTKTEEYTEQIPVVGKSITKYPSVVKQETLFPDLLGPTTKPERSNIDASKIDKFLEDLTNGRLTTEQRDAFIEDIKKGGKLEDVTYPNGGKQETLWPDKLGPLVKEEESISFIPVKKKGTVTFPGPNQNQIVFSGMLEKKDKLGALEKLEESTLKDIEQLAHMNAKVADRISKMESGADIAEYLIDRYNRNIYIKPLIKEINKIAPKLSKSQQFYLQNYKNYLLGVPSNAVQQSRTAAEWISETQVGKAMGIRPDTPEILLGAMRRLFSVSVLGLNTKAAQANYLAGGLNDLGLNKQTMEGYLKYRKEGTRTLTGKTLDELGYGHNVNLPIGRRYIFDRIPGLQTVGRYTPGLNKITPAHIKRGEDIAFKLMDIGTSTSSGKAYWMSATEAMEMGKKKGLKDNALIEFAHDQGIKVALKAQNMGSVHDQAPMFTGPFASVIFQFLRPVTKQADIVKELAGRALQGDVWPAIKFSALTGATIYAAHKLGGQNIHKDLLGFYSRLGEIGDAPLAGATESLAAFLSNIYHGEEATRDQLRAGAGHKVVGKFVPGGTQYNRTQYNMFPTEEQKIKQMKLPFGNEQPEYPWGERTRRAFLLGQTDWQVAENELRTAANTDNPNVRERKRMEAEDKLSNIFKNIKK